MSLGNVDLSRELVQAVRDAADILSVASEHTRLAKKGRDYQGLCPLHKEKTPSFHVDPDRGLFYCFGCNAGGDAIKLHMLATGDDFPAAIEALALRHGVPVQPRKARRANEPDVPGALAAAADFFRKELGRHELPRRYLAERKVPAELVERFEIGYAPDSWTALCEALAGRVPERDLEAAGLIAKSRRGTWIDRFRNRLMFPIHNPAGRLVGFGGRTLGDDQAKYVNTAETERFHKGELLYGLFQARRAVRDGGRVVLVEGYFDVVGTVAAGVEGAVATMGTALTPEQARLLARYGEEVVVAYDGDEAGERASLRALPILLGAGLAVHRARFPDGHDPDSLRLAAGPEAVARAVAQAGDGVIGEIERLAPAEVRRDPRRKAKATSDIAEILGRIKDDAQRFTYAQRASLLLELKPEVILRQIPQATKPVGTGETRQQTYSVDPALQTGRPDGRGFGRDLEEKVLRLLLEGSIDERTPFTALPVPESFHDPLCRRIYELVWTHWRDVGEPCTLNDLLTTVPPEDPAQSVLAGLFIDDGIPPTLVRIDLLTALRARYIKQQLVDIDRQLNDLGRGDSEREEQLLREKVRLSRELRPGSGGFLLGEREQPPGLPNSRGTEAE